MADAWNDTKVSRTGDRHPLRRAGERRGGGCARGSLGELSRRAALRSVDLLDTPPEEQFDRFTRLAATALGAPVSLITLVDSDRQFYKSATGIPASWRSDEEGPVGSWSFCRHTVALGETLAISDARHHGMVKNHPATMRGVVAYLGVPLVVGGGHVLGTLCVMDFRPRDWTERERSLLSELAASVVSQVELRACLVDAEQKARGAEAVQSALSAGEERFRSAFEMAPIGMGLVTPQGRWIEVNSALCHLFGYSRDELMERPLFELTHSADLRDESAPERMKVQSERYQLDRRAVHRDGREFWVLLSASPVIDTSGQPRYYIVQIQDLTMRKSEEERLRTLSLEDELTGLYNRRAFLAMAAEQIKLARRQEHRLLLLFADVDRMKWINDTFGHMEGDRAIRAVASVLKQTFRESDLVARLGGDEFAILAADVPENDLQRLIQRLTAKLGEVNAAYRGLEYPLSVSVGSALLEPTDSMSVEQLIELADAHMYRVKAAKPG